MADPENDDSYRLRRPGGEINTSRIFNTPSVVMALAVTTIIAFLLMVFAPTRVARALEFAAAVSPARFLAGPEANGGILRMLSPLIGHMFVHAGIMHLGFNLIWLLAFGTPVARRLGADGPGTLTAFAGSGLFLTFYFLGGIAGALVFVFVHAGESTWVVGASGGVSALLGGLVRFAFNRSTLFGPEAARISPLTSGPVLTWTFVFVLLNNPFSESMLGSMTGGARIAWEAHLGGYLFGLLTYPIFERIGRSFS